MRIFQKGFNFEQDGDGNRLVYHMQGCNMRCAWCTNPESMSAEGGIEVSVDEIVQESISCIPMFFDGGGITFTGGEPTFQFQELKQALSALKNAGINTAIETNATSPRLPELFDFIDIFIMDFKHWDSTKSKEFCCVGNEIIKENFEKICRLGKRAIVRIPLVNGVNSQPLGFADYFSQFDTSNVVFEFLPYHEYGKAKWKAPYKIENGFVSKDVIAEFVKVFESKNLKVKR